MAFGSLFRSARRIAGQHSAAAHETRRRLISSMNYELVPLKSVEAAIAALPPASPVSVTCSPTKGIATTLELTARLHDLGHEPVPHLAARLMEGRDHVVRLAQWCRAHGQKEIFLVAGDEAEPVGPYPGVVELLRDLLATDHGLIRIGVAAYPDGHALIDRGVLHEALHAKQALLIEAGVAGWASTQMCFDVALIRDWLTGERQAGLTMPIHLGLPGEIDRAKLLTMGVRLGIGASIRYVQKNRGALGRMFSPTGYDPARLIDGLCADAGPLGIEALHVFTFNNVEATARWQQAELA
jgi:methylenetetrahydrofolate reductase (NADPH)